MEEAHATRGGLQEYGALIAFNLAADLAAAWSSPAPPSQHNLQGLTAGFILRHQERFLQRPAPSAEAYAESIVSTFVCYAADAFGAPAPLQQHLLWVAYAFLHHHRQVFLEALAPLLQEYVLQQPLWVKLAHTCRGPGCGGLQCWACKHDAVRKCVEDATLRSTFLERDPLTPRCGAEELFAVCEDTWGNPVTRQHLTARGARFVEVSLLHGEVDAVLDDQQELLAWLGASFAQRKAPRGITGVLLPLTEEGWARLSDVRVTHSSKRGRFKGGCDCFRLRIRLLDNQLQPLARVLPLDTHSFEVATTRTSNEQKGDAVLRVNDPLWKLKHLEAGGPTELKFHALGSLTFSDEASKLFAARGRPCDVTNLGDLQLLDARTSDDFTLLKEVTKHLKLTKFWRAVCDEAAQAVPSHDSYFIWWCDRLDAGLVFAYVAGRLDRSAPVGLAWVDTSAPAGHQRDRVMLTQSMGELLRSYVTLILQEQADSDWFAYQHPKWRLYWRDIISGDMIVAHVPPQLVQRLAQILGPQQPLPPLTEQQQQPLPQPQPLPPLMEQLQPSLPPSLQQQQQLARQQRRQKLWDRKQLRLQQLPATPLKRGASLGTPPTWPGTARSRHHLEAYDHHHLKHPFAAAVPEAQPYPPMHRSPLQLVEFVATGGSGGGGGGGRSGGCGGGGGNGGESGRGGGGQSVAYSSGSDAGRSCATLASGYPSQDTRTTQLAAASRERPHQRQGSDAGPSMGPSSTYAGEPLLANYSTYRTITTGSTGNGSGERRSAADWHREDTPDCSDDGTSDDETSTPVSPNGGTGSDETSGLDSGGPPPDVDFDDPLPGSNPRKLRRTEATSSPLASGGGGRDMGRLAAGTRGTWRTDTPPAAAGTWSAHAQSYGEAGDTLMSESAPAETAQTVYEGHGRYANHGGHAIHGEVCFNLPPHHPLNQQPPALQWAAYQGGGRHGGWG